MKTTKRIGPTTELNPIMRGFLQLRGKYVWIFKVTELSLFFYLIYYLTSFTGTIPFYTLLVYIILYGILVANNSRVYYKVTGEQSLVINYAFIGITIFITLFIYLNYLLYSSLTLSYNTITKCYSSYNDLYWTCNQQNATGGVALPTELENILNSLNLTISKPW
jgi:glucan phosphoethanolaminetransferase (alkaline phosphatase superfamily)